MEKFKEDNYYLHEVDGDIIYVIEADYRYATIKIIEDPLDFWGDMVGLVVTIGSGISEGTYYPIYGYNSKLWKVLNG